MNEAHPIWERSLRISDDDSRDLLRRTVDPLIHATLMERGYTEALNTSSRIRLDGRSVIPSRAYMTALESQTFDALSLSTTTHVFDQERILETSETHLYKIGGLVSGRLVSAGGQYFAGVSKDRRTPPTGVATTPLNVDSFEDIIEDVRAHTPLGYSRSDTTPPFDQTLREISQLDPRLLIDRNVILSEDTDPDHGAIQYRLGETIVNRQRKGSRRRDNRLIGRMFEVSAKQPITDGSLESRLSYSSKRGRTQMKLSVVINGSNYSDEEKQALYDEEIRTFQDVRYNRFGDAVLKNLHKIKDPNSPVLRLG